MANSEWRTASGEWQTALTTRSRNGSEWRIVNANGNWRLVDDFSGGQKVGGRNSCRAKFSANREVGKSAGRETAANSEQRVASSFVWQCSFIAENFGLTTALSTSHSDWAHREVRPPKRRMNSALRKICQIPCPLSRAPCPSLAKASGMRRKI